MVRTLPALALLLAFPWHGPAEAGESAPPAAPAPRSGWPAPLPSFDPTHGASGVWVSETRVGGKSVRMVWKILHDDQEKIGLIRHDSDKKLTGVEALDHLSAWSAVTDARLSGGGFRAQSPTSFAESRSRLGESRSRLDLRWVSWVEMRGTVSVLAWTEEKGVYDWRPSGEPWPAVFRRVAPEIVRARCALAVETDGTRTGPLTIEGRNLPAAGSWMFLTNGIGEFPYLVKVQDGRIEPAAAAEKASPETLVLNVRIDPDLPAGVFGGYVGGRYVPELIVNEPGGGRGVAEFTNDAGASVAAVRAGGRCFVRLVTGPEIASKASAIQAALENTTKGETTILTLRRAAGGVYRSDPILLLEKVGPKDLDRSIGLYSVAASSPGDSLELRPAFGEAVEFPAVRAKVLAAWSGSLRGRVLAEGTGAPIQGASVSLIDVLSGRRVAVVRSDDQGRYALTPLQGDTAYLVVARRLGYSADSLHVAAAGGETVERDFTLAPRQGLVSGGVTDAETGKPIGGAEVALALPSAAGGRDETLDQTKTSPDGTYRFEGVAGRVRVVARAAGYYPTSRDLKVSASKAEKADFALISRASVGGAPPETSVGEEDEEEPFYPLPEEITDPFAEAPGEPPSPPPPGDDPKPEEAKAPPPVSPENPTAPQAVKPEYPGEYWDLVGRYSELLKQLDERVRASAADDLTVDLYQKSLANLLSAKKSYDDYVKRHGISPGGDPRDVIASLKEAIEDLEKRIPIVVNLTLARALAAAQARKRGEEEAAKENETEAARNERVMKAMSQRLDKMKQRLQSIQDTGTPYGPRPVTDKEIDAARKSLEEARKALTEKKKGEDFIREEIQKVRARIREIRP